MHDGETDVLEAVQHGNTISFQTDRFSTCALVLSDSVMDLPQTGDGGKLEWWLALLAVSTVLLLVLHCGRCRRAQKS